jgi:hypothetical protein
MKMIVKIKKIKKYIYENKNKLVGFSIIIIPIYCFINISY